MISIIFNAQARRGFSFWASIHGNRNVLGEQFTTLTAETSQFTQT